MDNAQWMKGSFLQHGPYFALLPLAAIEMRHFGTAKSKKNAFLFCVALNLL
ncbi:MAG: hypothetical protein IKR25_10860 [Muribaculaceae bacterium]|nr:hypothetical protein [Muribaculaceae bacterium]